jgi:hypothetical protein
LDCTQKSFKLTDSNRGFKDLSFIEDLLDGDLLERFREFPSDIRNLIVNGYNGDFPEQQAKIGKKSGLSEADVDDFINAFCAIF